MIYVHLFSNVLIIEQGTPNTTFGDGVSSSGPSYLDRTQIAQRYPVICRSGFWCGVASESGQGYLADVSQRSL